MQEILRNIHSLDLHFAPQPDILKLAESNIVFCQGAKPPGARIARLFEYDSRIAAFGGARQFAVPSKQCYCFEARSLLR